MTTLSERKFYVMQSPHPKKMYLVGRSRQVIMFQTARPKQLRKYKGFAMKFGKGLPAKTAKRTSKKFVRSTSDLSDTTMKTGIDSGVFRIWQRGEAMASAQSASL